MLEIDCLGAPSQKKLRIFSAVRQINAVDHDGQL